ncbi:hypothetical protein TNCV_1910911 [Trichonephila clavipes]|nr:hypothetical protein TNCV_1910911 [Trichonephila clavipes]
MKVKGASTSGLHTHLKMKPDTNLLKRKECNCDEDTNLSKVSKPTPTGILYYLKKTTCEMTASDGSFFRSLLPSITAHGDRFNSCHVIYSQFGLAIHQNDHQARRRFVEWAQSEIAVVSEFHKRILFSDEAHFWLNGYVNKQNCRIWREANPQVYVETPLHPEKLTVWCALWAGGSLLQKR